jgi:hypothetical protein
LGVRTHGDDSRLPAIGVGCQSRRIGPREPGPWHINSNRPNPLSQRRGRPQISVVGLGRVPARHGPEVLAPRVLTHPGVAMVDPASTWWFSADRRWHKGQPPHGWWQGPDRRWHPPTEAPASSPEHPAVSPRKWNLSNPPPHRARQWNLLNQRPAWPLRHRPQPRTGRPPPAEIPPTVLEPPPQ